MNTIIYEDWIKAARVALKGRQYELFCAILCNAAVGIEADENVFNTKAYRLFSSLNLVNKIQKDHKEYERKVERREQKKLENDQKNNSQNIDNQNNNFRNTNTTTTTNTNTKPKTKPISSNDEREKEEINPSPYNPPYPTLAEVEEYVFRFNLAVDARRFYSKMSGDGWMIDGEPVRDWKKLCQAWSRKQRESEEPDMSDRVLDDGTVIRNGKRYYTHPVSKHVIELPNNAPRRPDPALMYYFDEMDWKLPIQR